MSQFQSEPTAAHAGPQAQGVGGRGRAGIVGVGTALPKRKVENSYFEACLDTSDEWIRQRTGIQSRRIAAEDGTESLRHLLTKASEQACLSCQEVGACDFVLVASTTPTDLFGDAPFLAEALSIQGLVLPESGAFDVRAGCNGFFVAMLTAAKYLESGLHNRILVAGGETFSHWLDWTDRSTCVLFGDGAGAVVMERTSSGFGLISSALLTKSSDCLRIPLKITGAAASSPCGSTHAGTSDSSSVEGIDSASSTGSSNSIAGPIGSYGALQMRGSDVFSFVTTEVPHVIRRVLADGGYSAQDPKWFLLHQANHRILQVVADELGVPSERMLCNIQSVGNVGAASLPLLFKDAHSASQLCSGDLVVIAAFGAGLSWGACVMRWGEVGCIPACQEKLPILKSNLNQRGSNNSSNNSNNNNNSSSGNGSTTNSPSDTPTVSTSSKAELEEAIDAVLRQVHPELYEDEDEDLSLAEVCDSLSSMLFSQKLTKSLGGKSIIPPTILLEYDSLKEVIAAVQEACVGDQEEGRAMAQNEGCDDQVDVPSDGNDFEEFPCTSLQRSMLLKATSDQSGHHFLESFVWRLNDSSNIDVPTLQKAFLHVVQAHPSLHSSFIVDFDDGHWPKQRVWKCNVSDTSVFFGSSRVEPSFWFEVVKTKKDAHDVALSVAGRQRDALGQLISPPLFRMALIQPILTSKEAALVLTLPHALVDGLSMNILLSNFRDAYERLAGGLTSSPASPIAPPTDALYRDFAMWKAPPALIEGAIEHLKRCTAYLRNARGLSGPLFVTENFAPVRSRLRAPGLSVPLAALARQHHVTLATLLHMAFAAVWDDFLEPAGTLEGSRTVLFGSTVAGRSHPIDGIFDIVGLFVNIVPVAIALAGGLTDTLKKASTALLEGRHFEQVPLATAMEGAGCGHELQVIFDYQDDGAWMKVPIKKVVGGANDVIMFDGELIDRTGMPLSVRVTRDGEDMLLAATLETDQLPPSTAASVVHCLHNALSILAALPSEKSQKSWKNPRTFQDFPSGAGPKNPKISNGSLSSTDLPLSVLSASISSVRGLAAALYSFSGGASSADNSEEEEELGAGKEEETHEEGPKEGCKTSSSSRSDAESKKTTSASAAAISRTSNNNNKAISKAAVEVATAPIVAPSETQDTAKSPLQELLCDVVAQVLSLPGGGPSLGLNTNLRTLGFDSLRAMRALGLLKGRGLKVSLRELLAAQTISALSSKAVATVAPSVGPGPKILGSVKGELEGSLPFPLQEVSRQQGNQPYPLFGVGAAHFVGLHASSFTSSELGKGGIAPQIYWEWIFGEDGEDSIGAGQVDVDKFESALDLLVARHPTLRATVLEDGRMFAPDVPPGRCRAQVVAEWQGNQQAAQQAAFAARSAMSGGGDAIGSPHEWPLFAFRITHVGPNTSVVHLAISLFLMDAVSDLVFRAELSKVYRSLVKGQDPMTGLTPKPSLRFGDYCRSLVDGLPQSSSYAAARKFWDEKIRKGLPDGPALPRLPRSAAEEPNSEAGRAFKNASKWFSKSQWEQTKENCARYGVTIPTALLTAYCLALSRHQEAGSTPRFLINVLLCLRYPVHEEMDRVLGNCSSTILVDIDLTSGGVGGGLPSFEKASKLVATALSESLEHSTMSGVEVMEAINRSRRSTFSAVAPFIFTTPIGVEKGTGGDAQKRDWCFREQFFSERVPHTACVNAIKDDPATGGACASMDIVSGAFPEDVSEALTKTYSELLSILSSEEPTAWDKPAEAHLEKFAAAVPVAAPVELTGSLLLQDGLLEAAERYPNAPAVIAAEGLGNSRLEVSYDQLISKSRETAVEILNRVGGVGKDQLVVAIVMEKSWQQVVAVHAILLAGGAYLPTEPRLWPEARVKSVLEVSGAQAAIATAQGLAQDYAWLQDVGLPVVSMDEELSSNAAASAAVLASLPKRQVAPTDPAYLIYTSGSSGKPKGVVCHHLGAVNTLRDLNRRWKVTQSDRCLALSSLAFDLSVYDIFGLLQVGGAIVVPPASAMSPPDPELWASIAQEEKVSLWNSVPAFVDLLVAAVELCELPLPNALRLVFMSGDWIPLQLPSRLAQAGCARLNSPELKVISMGGATEAAIWSNQYEIASDGSPPHGWTSIPYGVPLQNQTMYILQEPSLEHAAPWVIGVIYIGGLGVASGYHKDATKTAAQFITHPRTGEKLFRTGDLGRLRGGLLEICGREDAQVKLNGFRVELGEIEVALLGPTEDGTLKVVAAAASVQDSQLCAHLVLATTDGEDRPTDLESSDPAQWSQLCQELRARCVAKLPQYMVPAFFGTIAALPLSANGKLQRDKLPRPLQLQVGSSSSSKVAEEQDKQIEKTLRTPNSKCERAIRKAMASILKVDESTICCDTGDFFALGGSSVTALRLLFALRDDPDLVSRGPSKSPLLTIRDLLSGATVSKLAALLEERGQSTQAEVGSNKASVEGPKLDILTLSEGSGEAIPLVLINPAGASCLCYMDLSKALEQRNFSGRIVGLDDGGVMRDDGVVGFKSIEEVAESALEQLRIAAGGAPRVLLAGWSYGGVVAVEVAKKLAKKSSSTSSLPSIAGLVLFDAPLCGAVVSGGPGEKDEEDKEHGVAAERPSALTQAPAKHFEEATKLLRTYHAHGGAATDLQALPCPVLDIRPNELDASHPPEPKFEWSKYGNHAQYVEVPGSHWTLLSKSVGVEVVAEAALRWMDENQIH